MKSAYELAMERLEKQSATAKLTDAQKGTLSVRGRVKLWAHGGRQAHAEFADRCHGCGLCVAACPEKAISLERSK